MPYEVVNTSSARGLTEGHAGFCDVIRTRGLPEEITPLLAPLNFYDHALGRGRPAHGVRTIRFGGHLWGVVSRVVANGNDYTGRPNRLAHHVVMPPSELDSYNPADILLHFAFRESFDGSPRYLDREPVIEDAESACDDIWDSVGGIGWCSHIARIGLSGSRAAVLVPPTLDGRQFIAALLSRLPSEQRWEFGIVESATAEQCWAQGVKVRILALEPDDPAGNRSWPGEVVVDLRTRHTPPAKEDRVRAPSVAPAVPGVTAEIDFSVFQVDVPWQGKENEAAKVAEKSDQNPSDDHPIIVDFDDGALIVDAAPIGPLKVHRSWTQILFWLVCGCVAGGFVGVLIRVTN